MSPITAGIIGIVAVFFLIACRMSVGLAMMLVGFVGFGYIVSFSAAFQVMSIIPFDLISKYDYCVLPLFLFMASICLVTGLGKSLYKLAYAWLGHLPGGLGLATICACGLFSAISASSLATAITMGLVAIPEMLKHNYHSSLAAGCCAAGGTLGILIPPSGILIIYGILTEQSIQKLFAASFFPGIILTLIFMCIVYIQGRIKPRLAPRGQKSTFKQRMETVVESGEIILLIIFVLGGLIIGWFTPTEAGAVGAFGTIVISLIRRRLDISKFMEAVLGTINNTGLIFLVLVGAFILNQFLAVSTIPMELADIVSGFDLPGFIIMGIIFLIYIVLGCMVDALAMILLTVPVFYPLVTNLGYDPIWFGVTLVIVVEMGMITPPIGMNVFAISGIVDVPMYVIFRGVMPFFLGQIFFVILLLFFPQIVFFVPNLLF